jgi:hypothetical protein
MLCPRERAHAGQTEVISLPHSGRYPAETDQLRREAVRRDSGYPSRHA